MEQFVKVSSTSSVTQHKKERFIEKIQFSHGKRGKNSLNKILIICTFSLSPQPKQNHLLLFSLSESNPSTFPIPFNKLHTNSSNNTSHSKTWQKYRKINPKIEKKIEQQQKGRGDLKMEEKIEQKNEEKSNQQLATSKEEQGWTVVVLRHLLLWLQIEKGESVYRR